MGDNRILGISRANIYSPNHIGNDAAIFNLTCSALKEFGLDVRVMDENEFLQSGTDVKNIFSMARSQETIIRLKELENKGYKVVNSAYGNENCCRERMTTLLINNNIPHPKSIIIDTTENLEVYLNKDEFIPCWIKRGDFHAIHREDVSNVRNREEAKSIINEYRIRGIKRAVVNEHLVGDLVKFYGVADTNFFYWFYPFDVNHSKFGLEAINGESKGIPFDISQMQGICNNAAAVLNVKIYGGDCIVATDGTIRIIDFNDWPSFAPCREIAADYIAKSIILNNIGFEFINDKKKINNLR